MTLRNGGEQYRLDKGLYIKEMIIEFKGNFMKSNHLKRIYHVFKMRGGAASER